MKKTKIAFIIPNLMSGGAEKVLVNLVNNMNNHRYCITIISVFDVGTNKKYINSNINYKYIFKRQFKGNSHVMKLFTPKLLSKFIIREDYDVVVSFLEGIASRIVSGLNNKHTKKIAWLHTDVEINSVFSKGFRNYYEAKKSYLKFDEVVFVSNNIKDSFYKHIDFHAIDGQVIHNINETKKIIELSKHEVSDVCFDRDVLNICSVGKIDFVKGYDRLARIQKKLLSSGYNAHFYIIGEGPEKLIINKFLKANNIEEKFTFLGYKENPYKYLNNCDLFVCSSRREGLSTAVTEALILGIPVISTDCSGTKELLGDNGEYGLITSNSEESLHEALVKVIKNSKLLKDMKEKAYIRGQQFDKNTILSKVEKLFVNKTIQ